MNNGRWYPTNTTLPNGDVLVASGWINTQQGVNVEPQVWQTATASWRNLSTAHLALPFYPFMFVAPNGKVFCAGPSQTSRYLDTSGSGAWSVVANSNYGVRNWGSAVMYDIGKVLMMGGSPCAAILNYLHHAPDRNGGDHRFDGCEPHLAIHGSDGWSTKTSQRYFTSRR